jgi:hypothetical protein
MGVSLYEELSQIYYSVIYPYISYAVLAWGSPCTLLIQKVQVKQNHAIRLIFVKLYDKDTASALPLLNLLDILTVENVYHLHLFMRGTKVCCHTHI